MSSHSKAAAKFIADAPRTAWHDKALFAVRTKRDKMMHEVPEWEALREASSQIKRHTLSHLLGVCFAAFFKVHFSLLRFPVWREFPPFPPAFPFG